MAEVLHCPRNCHGIVVTHCATPGCGWHTCSVCGYYGLVDGPWLEPIRTPKPDKAES